MLGGGQLGRMLLQAAVDLNLYIAILDADKDAPCAAICHEFSIGDPTDFDQVYNFGKDKDLVTIEIENVNADALQKLKEEGKKVYPQPSVIKIIQDKRLQKQFYKENGIPTSEFILIEDKSEIKNHIGFLPAFQKLGRSGYDGRGVQKIGSAEEVSKALEGKSLLEKAVDFDKELAVIVSRNEKGEISCFPVVEMAFHPIHNLVEYLFAPASVSPDIEAKAREIAIKVISKLEMVGLLAVEMFLSKSGEILVNEVAPRPHNSGHHTIEANITSQYEQHLRAILNLPPGSTEALKPAAMVNLLGEAGYNGLARYEGIDKLMQMKGVYLHLYGKKYTKPFRKMGHITILADQVSELKEKAEQVKQVFKVIA
ncbi:MAG: 5-(carboxyamino)imidazole ribonucleotide synthase [Cytophagaceae bacterium]